MIQEPPEAGIRGTVRPKHVASASPNDPEARIRDGVRPRTADRQQRAVTISQRKEVPALDPTHRQRQATYRFWHPQLMVTFRSRPDWILVAQTLQQTGESPQRILLRWARQHHAESDTPKS